MFKNRKDAGEQLAKALIAFKKKDPLLLAIPRGGVEVGYYVAKILKCDFSLVISRKLGHPEQPEAAVGAVAEDKSLYLNPRIHRMLTKEVIDTLVRKEEKEIRRRIDLYRKGTTLPPIQGRVVIIIDDGIATGSTLFATIELCKKKNASRIVVAAPVSTPDTYDRLLGKVDDVVILETPSDFFAVSQAYEEFSNLTDKEVVQFMERASLIDKDNGRKSIPI